MFFSHGKFTVMNWSEIETRETHKLETYAPAHLRFSFINYCIVEVVKDLFKKSTPGMAQILLKLLGWRFDLWTTVKKVLCRI